MNVFPTRGAPFLPRLRFDRANNQRALLRAILSQLGNTVAWYQPGVGVTGTLNASAWANQLGIAGSLEQATGANQPIYLPDGHYAWFPAVAGNTLTSPDQTVTGNQTITFDIALNDYTPAADVTLSTKTSGNDGFIVKWLTTDKIRLVVGDGASLTNVDVVAASSFTDGSRHSVTIDWEDGVGATFSYDGVVSGSQVAAAKTLTNAAVVMTVGSTTSIGKVYRFQVGSVYDMNPALSVETTANAATFTGGEGETWTLNNTGALVAQIVGSPKFLFDGIATFLEASMTLTQPFGAYLVGQQPAWEANRGILSAAGNDAICYKTHTGASPDIAMALPTAPTANNSNWTLNTDRIVYVLADGANSLVQVDLTTATTGDPGSNGGTVLRLGALVSGNTFGNVYVKELIVRSAADSAATRLAIQQRLAAIHGIAL